MSVLGSGSSGNSTLLAAGRTRVLLDAGFSCKELTRRLAEVGESPERLDAVVVSHEHSDHIKGLRVLCKKHGVPVYATEASWAASGLQDAPEIPEVRFIEPGRPFDVGDLHFVPFRVPHDAAECVGFRVEGEGLALGHVTDLGQVTHLVEERLRDCDVLVLESNHDVEMLRWGPYPWPLKQRIAGDGGHLSNDATARLLDRVWSDRTRHVYLAHMSEKNNHPEIALPTVRAALGRDRHAGTELRLTAQDRVSEPIEL
jgi:phosphoribosyl 1,2-cyclic phosphodiesterase